MNVLDHLVDDPDASHVAALLLALVDAAERAKGRVPGLLRIEPSRDVCVDLLLQVKADLVIEFAFDLAPADERAKTKGNRAPQRLGFMAYVSSSRNTFVMAPDRRAQLAASVRSLARPRAVRA